MEVIRVLKADLFYYYITENYDIGIKLSILEFIRECVKITEDKKREMPVNSSSCKTFINDICLRTCQYLVLTNYHNINVEGYNILYKRELINAKTTQRVKQYYPECDIHHGNVKNQGKYIELMVKKLETKILFADPEYILIESAYMYYHSYDAKLGLFSSPNNGEYVRKYLLNLSSKLLFKSSANKKVTNEKEKKLLLKEIIDLSDIIISSYEPFVYSQFEFMFADYSIDKITKMMLNGAMVSNQQYHPNAIYELVNGCFSNFDQIIQKETKLSLELILSIHQVLTEWFQYTITNPGKKEFIIRKAEFINIIEKKLPSIPTWKINAFYNRFVCKTPVNQLYYEPWNVENVDLEEKYLLGSPNGSSIYFPLMPLCSFGLFEEISRILNYNSHIGNNFEQFIQEWIEKNFDSKVYHGKYILDNAVYESDGILIIDNNIILLECKRKPLTRKARSGHIDKVLVDVSKSFLTSALQAYRCETAIRQSKLFSLYSCEHGDKDILNGKIKSDFDFLVPESPKFIRLSVTPNNFGMLNEVVICHNIFYMFIKYNYKSDEPDVNKDFEEIPDIRGKMLEFWDCIKSHYTTDDGEYLRNITMNSVLIPYNTLYFLTSKNLSDMPPLKRLENYLHVQSGSYNYFDIIKSLIFKDE